MKLNKCNLYNNYYTKIDCTKIYVDYPNRRVKIIDIDSISSETLNKIISLSVDENLDKVICNCDVKSIEVLEEAGFKMEGKIDGYFRGKDAFCMSYFLSKKRKISRNLYIKNLLIKQCLELKDTFIYDSNKYEYYIRDAEEKDINEMVKLFSAVFSSYPSPIYNEEYLRQTMHENVLYKVADYNGKIVGIASADMDRDNLNAEITDCATYLNYRGKGILSNIIHSLEKDLKKKGFITLYSLCRAINPGINIVLSKHNYKFTGRLINNCNICGAFEDMNIWIKNIHI